MQQSEAGAQWSRGWRRIALALGVGLLGPLGSIKVGSWAAAFGTGAALAVIAWTFIGLIANQDDR